MKKVGNNGKTSINSRRNIYIYIITYRIAGYVCTFCVLIEA